MPVRQPLSETITAGGGCKLIINADDLGISVAVNNGIIQAHREGIVTSASIMPNGSAYDDALSQIEIAPSLDLGVHLTLVEEAPLTNSEDIRSLVDQSGRLHKNAYRFVRQYVLGRICLSEVERELDAQIRKVRQAGITVSHLDSHQHLHILPALFRIVVRLADKYKIPAIRIPREQFKARMIRENKLRRVVELLTVNALCRGRSKGFTKLAGTFVGFYDGGHLDLANLSKILKGLNAQGVYELMCHPGEAETKSDYKHWGYSPEKELSALTAPEAKKLIVDRNIELTTYAALADASARHS